MSAKILLVEDHENTRESLQRFLSMKEYQVVAVPDRNNALIQIKSQQFDAALIDLKLPTIYGSGDESETYGLAVVQAARKHSPSAWIAVITAHGDAQTARQSMQHLGADEFLDKPIDYEDLIFRLQEELSKTSEQGEIQAEFYEWPVPPPPEFMGIVGETPEIQAVCEEIKTYASSPVKFGLVWGESGTGKELVSLAIHQANPRRTGECLIYNCAAISEDLPESELFGVVEGAATGVDARDGCFQLASGGTLILDEAQSLPAKIQAQLLRAVQYDEVQRVGGRIEKVDVRTILVSNQNLDKSVEDGEFRADLLNRLGFKIYIPPLRERKADIPHLVNHFIRQYQRGYEQSRKAFPLTRIYPTVWEWLADDDWPGNLHELKRVVESALTHLSGWVLGLGDLYRAMRQVGQQQKTDAPPDNPLDAWYLWVKNSASSGRPVDYDAFKKYAVIRAIDEIAAKEPGFQWTTVGKQVGFSGNIASRVKEVIRGIAKDLKETGETNALIERVQKGEARDFVLRAIKYYGEKLSGN